SSRVLSSSDDPGKYTDYDEDMFNFMYYGIPLPGMQRTPRAEQSNNRERDIDDVEELVRTAAADDVTNPDWGLTAPPTVSGTNPGMSQECDVHSAIININTINIANSDDNAHLPERHYKTTNMISVSKTIGRGRGYVDNDAAGLPGNPTASTAGLKPSSTRDSNNQQTSVEMSLTDHSNFVAPIRGEEITGAAWRASTTRHTFGTRLNDDEQLLSMPKLSREDTAALQRELEHKQRECDLMLEVERLRYERSLGEETARQDAVRAKLESDVERLKAARDRMELLQMSAAG